MMSRNRTKKKAAKHRIALKARRPVPTPVAISERWVVFLVGAILVLLWMIFFYQVLFEGKVYVVPDAQAGFAFDQMVRATILDKGVYPLWNPYRFSGMPSFGSGMACPFIYPFDTLFYFARQVFPLPELLYHLTHYLLAAAAMLLLLRYKGIGWSGSMLGAITYMFAPFLIVMITVGHGGKLFAAAYLPLVFLLVEQILRGRSWFHALLLGVIAGLQFIAGHIQIMYYTWMLVGTYILFQWVMMRIEGQGLRPILRSAGQIALGLLIGLCIASVVYLSVYEYTPYSIRGGGETGGVALDYAVAWSFNPKEMLTFIIPGAFGFGGVTYWGSMPFTDFPNYLGVVPLIFVLAALLLVRQRLVKFLAVFCLFSLLVSFGRHLLPFYELLYHYLPFFNKFRVPSMILILVNFGAAVLAGYGSDYLFSDTWEKNASRGFRQAVAKWIWAAVGVLAVMLFLVLLLRQNGTSLFPSDWFVKAGEGQRYTPQILARLRVIRVDRLATSLVMVLLLGIAILTLTALRLRGLIHTNLFQVLAVGLVVADLWAVDFKLNHPSPYREFTRFYREDAIVRFLKKQEGLFRILPVERNEFASNRWEAHRIGSVGGYYPAKLQIYNEILEQVGFGSIGLLNMLNTRYLISKQPIAFPGLELVFENTQRKVYENKNALPRAFLVDQIKVIQDKAEIFQTLQNPRFDPSAYAILEEEPEFTLGSKAGSTVEVVAYDFNRIDLRASIVNPCLLVLSEIYYPAGWKAYIDGQETRIYKTNYILRSIVVPPGEHEVTFVFDPWAFKVGFWVTLVTVLGLVGVFGLVGIRYWQRQRGQVDGL